MKDLNPIVETQLPCEDCGSSDALVKREDGSTYCFSCQTNTKKGKDMGDPYVQPAVYHKTSMGDVTGYRSYAIDSRGISKQVVDHFGIRMGFDENRKPLAHYYPYYKDGNIVAYKERVLPKEFRVIGDFKDVELFGQQAVTGTHTLVITEGELDACAVAEAMLQTKGSIYPVVSIPSASNLRTVLTNREWINKFIKIVLMLDQDEAGKKAVNQIAKMLPADKVFVASMPEKDPCAVLMKHGAEALIQSFYSATQWSPAGIVVGENIWDQFMERRATESIPYPECLEGLNRKLKGIRQGEITLFTSGTGSGKSTVIKEIVLDLLSKTEDKIGLISLEESVGDTAEKFISMALKRPVMDPPSLTEEEMRVGFDEVFGDERLILLDHQGSVSDDSLLDKIDYMALMGCKYLILDHITIAVSEGSEGLSGNEAVDKVMSDLLKIVKRHNVWLGLVSHLRKTNTGKGFEEGKPAGLDDIKGSGSIKQISYDVIAFARDLTNASDKERNTVYFRVLKSRFTGDTGDAGSAYYDPRTTRLSQAVEI